MKEKISLISIFVNLLLAGFKIIIGFFANSAAILAEGIHSFMDILSSTIGYLGIKISQKPEDQRHPYGHYKFEVLAGLLITIILFGTGVGIIWQAYQKFLNPSLIQIPFLAFSAMLFSVVANEIMARVKIHFGEKENSLALLSDGAHSRVDVYASLAVFIGLFLTKYWLYTDSVLALLIGFYIIKESLSLGKEAADSLLDVSAGPGIEDKISSIVKSKNIQLDSLKTQKKGSVITANLAIKLASQISVSEATETSDNLRKKLMAEIDNLSYIVIQIKSQQVETGFYQPAIGRGFGWLRRGKFKKEFEKAESQGSGGWCVCSKCGYKIEHQPGVPCSSLRCPECQINLERR